MFHQQGYKPHVGIESVEAFGSDQGGWIIRFGQGPVKNNNELSVISIKVRPKPRWY